MITKTYIVHMLAHCDPTHGCGPTVIRPVRIPEGEIDPPSRVMELERVFHYGQNDNCTDETLIKCTPSVSAGDVVEFPDGEFWLIMFVGSKKLTKKQFDEYCTMDRANRIMSYYDME